MTSGFSALIFDTRGYDPEIWIAMLQDWPIESFWEEENKVTAYLESKNLSPELRQFIQAHQGERFGSYVQEELPDQNWNAVWESSFHPVAIDQYCYIRAHFHEPAPPGFKHIIEIAPKMAFGTGHHATTYMMMQAMAKLDIRDKSVLDYGCGTGILAILAAKEGAAQVWGIDIQPEAIENSIEHAGMNRVDQQCSFFQGDLDVLPAMQFDIILANIQTSVILPNLATMYQRVKPGGFVLLSGILNEEGDRIQSAASAIGLQLLELRTRDGWMQFTFQKA